MFTINQNLIDDFADKINEKEKKNNKVTSLSSSSTHVQYPSAKAVYDAISEVEASSGGNYIYDFVQYELSSSDYNPTIDSTITITCTCKNILGNPIANKTLELMMNGVSQGTSTTNANGIATWTITLDTWGNKHFHIGNATLDLVVTGFKEVTETNQTYYVGEDIVHLFMHYNGSLTATTSWKDFGAVVGQSARPSANIPFMEQFGAVILRVKTNGVLQYRSITGSNVSMSSIVAYANWKI